MYVYFDNDIKVRAPYDAQALQAQLDARAAGDAGPIRASAAGWTAGAALT